jgi:hypothetical protein
LQFASVNYGDIKAIKGLLWFYTQFKGMAEKNFNPELIAIYVDIDNAINKIPWTLMEREILNLYISGYTVHEIEEMLQKKNIVATVTKCSKMISKFLLELGYQPRRKRASIIGGMGQGRCISSC